MVVWIPGTDTLLLLLLHHSQPSKRGSHRKEVQVLRFSVRMPSITNFQQLFLLENSLSQFQTSNSSAYPPHITKWQTVVLSWKDYIDREDPFVHVHSRKDFYTYLAPQTCPELKLSL